MAIPVNIPKLGMTMEQAKLSQWKASQGEWVEKGKVVLVIETEKVTWEVEATGSGFLHIIREEGQQAKVGAIVGMLCETEGELDSVKKEYPIGKEVTSSSGQTETDTTVQKTKEASHLKTAGPVKSSPAARRLAKELSIDLSMVKGSGPEGRIVEADVRKFHEQGPPAPKITPLAEEMARKAGIDINNITGSGEGGKITREDIERVLSRDREQEKEEDPIERLPFTGMRKAIADNMFASLHNTAQLTTFTEVDATAMIEFRKNVQEEFKKNPSVKVSYNDIIIMAVSRALKQFPMMNSNLVGEEILVFNSVHMGIAVAVSDGLVVPVLRNADRKTLLEIAAEARELALKAREGRLGLDDMEGGTFTISNTSMFPVDGATPILKPPETGILGISRIKEKPAVYNGEIAIRAIMVLSLTFDHRVIDGAPAAEFVGTVARYIEKPTLILC